VNALGLEVINTGSEQTCVRQRGGSIVDVTLASVAVSRMVSGWRVVTGSETLSDHLYIRLEVSDRTVVAPLTRKGGTPSSVRWMMKRLDRDILVAQSSPPGQTRLDGTGWMWRKKRSGSAGQCRKSATLGYPGPVRERFSCTQFK